MLSDLKTCALSLGCFALCLQAFSCGGQNYWQNDDMERFYEVPLVEAFEPSRPAVEIAIDGVGPILFAVDSALTGAVITRDAAKAIGLAGAEHLNSTTTVTAKTLTIGDLTLHDVALAVSEREELGSIGGRRIQGVLGDVLFPEDRAIELVPQKGVLRLWQKETPEEKASRMASSYCLQEGRGATVEVQLEQQKRHFTLSTNARSAVDQDVAFDLDLESVNNGYYALLGFAGFEKQLLYLGVYSGPGDGILGYAQLNAQRLFISKEGTFVQYKNLGDHSGILSRFGDLGCGEGFKDCLQGEVIARGDGYVELEFQKPARVIAPRYWMRVDYGRNTAKTALIALQPGLAARTLRTRIEDPSLNARNTRAAGEAVSLIDLVVVSQDCSGDLCVR